MALSGCGWTGLGLARDRRLHSVPPSEFSGHIGAIIGEAFEWVGIGFVWLVRAAFVVAGLSVCARARDRYGLLLGAGIVSLIGLQALLHLAVVTRLLPAAPVPLPFVSYGGAELCVLLTGVGVLLSIARQEPLMASGCGFAKQVLRQ